MNALTVAVLTVSDSASKKEGRRDTSGPLAVKMLSETEFSITQTAVIPDEIEQISQILKDWADDFKVNLIITTGGTGLFPRDVTPEATAAVIEKEIPGIQEAIRNRGLTNTPRAMLSRGMAGIRGTTLIINLPGSPAAVQDGLETVIPILKHAVNKINGDSSPCSSPHHNN